MFEPSLEEEWVLARHPGPEGRMIQAERNMCQDTEPTECSQSLLSSVPSCKNKDIVGLVISQILQVLRFSDSKNESSYPG